MKEGFYSISYRGITDWGFAVIVLADGAVIGADHTGGLYDGTYAYNRRTKRIDTEITVTVPSGLPTLLWTLDRDREWNFSFSASFPRRTKETAVVADTPMGPLDLVFRFLRPFP